MIFKNRGFPEKLRFFYIFAEQKSYTKCVSISNAPK
jgi:hypothetical protein